MNELKNQIEQVLGKFWDERVIEISQDPHSTCEIGAPLDSLSSCEVLAEIDQLVEQIAGKIPAEKVIQKGGYENREQFVAQLTAGVMDYLGGKANERTL